MSFYALWKIPQINYYDGVGSSNLLFTENATSWDTNRWTVVITNKIPVKKGYIFAGWADAEGHHVGIVEGRNNALPAEVRLFEIPRTFGKGHYCLIRTYARERSVLNEERLRVRPGLVHCVNISVVE